MERCAERYLLCPAALTIGLLHKLIKAKFGLTQDSRDPGGGIGTRNYHIEMLHSDEILPEEMTLSDVVYMYGWQQVRYPNFSLLYSSVFVDE